MLSLTRRDTSVIKGIAICAMLLHHMYGAPPPDVVPYSGIIEWIGILGKVCVALFLFCSGYGLAANYKLVSFREDFKFIGRRLVKFYLNYWVIFFIFVPITIFAFHRPLSAAYGDNYVWWHFILDIFGMQGIESYNVTWWFNQLIVLLYLFFPLLYRLVRIKPWMGVLVGMLLMRLSTRMPINPVEIFTFQFPFVLGVVWNLYEGKWANLQVWFVKHSAVAITISIFLLINTIIIRMYPIIPHWSAMRIDGYVACAIVLCVITIIRNLKYTTDVLAFFGKHSMNVYMTHTFINWYW